MSFMDRAKAAAEQMKARAQEGMEEVQTKKELAQAYWDLGHKAHELSAAGALSHPELDPLAQRITDLLAHDGTGSAPGTPSGEPPAQPEQTTTTTPPETPA